MAVFETTHATSNGYLFGGRLSTFTGNAYSNFNKWNDMRATRKALSKLSLRELDDIGLLRSDISTFKG